MQEGVEYRDIPGFNGYKAGSDGTLWSAYIAVSNGKKGSVKVIGNTYKEIKPCTDRDGYKIARLSVGRYSPKAIKVHRAVLLAFVGECPKGHQCCHADGNPANNRVENLRWADQKSNYADRKKHGTSNDGIGNGRAKLNESIVKCIRQERAKSNTSYATLAKQYGVTPAAIRFIVTKRTWPTVA